MLSNNREWLQSLSDKQLESELRYGGARGSNHDAIYERAHQEAKEEKARRDDKNR